MRMDCQGGWGEAGLGGLGLHTQEPGGRREILLVGGVHDSVGSLLSEVAP